MKRNLFLALTIVFISSIAHSQWIYTSTYSADSGNPGGVNSEADAPGQGSWTTVIGGPQAANIWSPVVTIPFAFNFYGSPVTQLKASQNGLVTFDVASALLPNANVSLPTATLPDNTICGFWDEFTAAAPTGSGDDIRTNTFGTAPNRQFWITWYSFEMGNPVNSFSYFSVVLEETTNNVYVVDKYSTTSTLTSTVGVQLNATTGFDVGNNISLSSNGTSITDNDFYSFFPLLLVNDDAGVSAVINPNTPLSPGLQNIDISVENFGINTLNSFTVNWELNSVLQPPFLYTSPSLAPGATSTPINVGSYNFPTGFTDMKFWTSVPNGTTDGNPLNDTLFFSACTALSGIYSIGGVTPDFITISDAIVALNSCGISGPVTFNIAPGVYNDFASLPVINGSSAVNTITFNGGSANTTSIVHDGIGQMATIGFTGADYITWKNLTIQNTNVIDGWGVHMSDTSDFNVIDSCRIIMDSMATQDIIGIVISGSSSDDFTEGNGGNNNIFSNNEIFGGEMGIHLEGPTANGEWIVGNQFINNDIHGMDDYGIYFDNVDSINIVGNKIYDIRNAQGDGIYCFDIANFNISGNSITVSDYAFYISDGNFDFPVSSQSTVINNMFISTTDYATYLDDINNIDIYHNTFLGNPAIRINDFVNLDVRNNIFTSEGDFAFESDDDILGNAILDYNMYYTPATNTNFVDVGVNVYPDLATWQGAVAANNVNSIEVQPEFTSATDLHRVGINGNDLGDNSIGITIDIDGDSRPQSPSIVVDMGADEYTPLSDDAVLIDILLPGWSCGDSNTLVYAVVSNLGTNVVLSLPITVDISGDFTATLNTVYTGLIPYGQIDTVLVGTINTYNGGLTNVDGWIALLLDQNQLNDSLYGISAGFIPFEPVGENGYGCGADSALISAAAGYPVSYSWYDAPVGGTEVGTGNTFMVPSIVVQNTYYLEYSASIDSLETTYAAGNGCGGGAMIDVTSSAGSVVTGLRVNGSAGAGISVPVNIHYVVGGYVGNETNALAWTSAGSYTVTSNGLGVPSSLLTLSTPIALPPGTPIGIYIEYDADYTNGTTTFTNGNITIDAGVGLCSAFGGVNQGRMFNGTLFFGGSACSSIRTPVSAQTVAPITTDLGADTSICAPSISLDAGNPTAAFVWSNGATSQINIIDTAGIYWVDVVDTNGCTATDTVDLFINPLNVTLPATVTACLPDSVFLSPVVTEYYGYTFTWSNSNPTIDATIVSTGTYTVDVVDTMGCSSSATVDVTISDIPVSSFTNVLGTSGVIVNVTSTATGSDSTVYDFGDGSPFVTADNSSHTYLANGTYTICQYVFNDCGSNSSCTTIVISSVGVEELNSNKIVLFPNPATESLQVSFTESTVDLLEVLTAEGKIVSTHKVSDQTININVASLQSGVYFVRVTGSNGIGIKRFVKK